MQLRLLRPVTITTHSSWPHLGLASCTSPQAPREMTGPFRPLKIQSGKRESALALQKRKTKKTTSLLHLVWQSPSEPHALTDRLRGVCPAPSTAALAGSELLGASTAGRKPLGWVRKAALLLPSWSAPSSGEILRSPSTQSVSGKLQIHDVWGKNYFAVSNCLPPCSFAEAQAT